jgi:putative sugar O-methyltransferase
MKQIQDRPDLLEAMLGDMETAPSLYRPSNFWDHYQRESYRYIKARGIREFRSHTNRLWASFGAVADPLLGYALPLLGRAEGAEASLGQRIFRWVARRAPFFGKRFTLLEKLTDAYESQLRMLLELSYHYCSSADKSERINRIGDSGLGAPNIVMEIDGRYYTIHFLRHFLQYMYLTRFVDFDKVQSIVEIGGGYGGLAEVTLKLHPHIVYVDVDIPPQIYLASQYLSACFEGKVAGYDETRNLVEIACKDHAGKQVFPLCPWQLPSLRGKFDLFINSASFQEMEPDIVKNYADYLNRLVTEYGYIRAMPKGAFVANKPGERGVLKKTTGESYIEYFHTFELIDESTAEVLPNLPGTLSVYRDMLFKKKSAVY